MIKFSPGIVQGCFQALTLATKHRMTFLEIRSSFAYLEGLATIDILESAQALNWLKADKEGYIVPTVSGIRLLSYENYEMQLRQAILDYIDIEKPPWIQNASFGRARVLAFADSGTAQVFTEANLTEGTSDEIIHFWDALAVRARGQKNDRLNMIGRMGEKLSIQFEEQRTGKTPQWVAINDNSDGYDVLSIVKAEDPRKLSIEVKSSAMGKLGQLFLTRNEWERAIETREHVFHIWDLSDINKPKLAVIKVKEMQSHIPENHGEGLWKSVEVPIAVFSDCFGEVFA